MLFFIYALEIPVGYIKNIFIIGVIVWIISSVERGKSQ